MTNSKLKFITRAMAVILDEPARLSTMRMALSGTPHVLVRMKNMTVSVCYVRSMQCWCVFYPYYPAGAKQTKVTCQNATAVVKYIEDLQ